MFIVKEKVITHSEEFNERWYWCRDMIGSDHDEKSMVVMGFDKENPELVLLGFKDKNIALQYKLRFC